MDWVEPIIIIFAVFVWFFSRQLWRVKTIYVVFVCNLQLSEPLRRVILFRMNWLYKHKFFIHDARRKTISFCYASRRVNTFGIYFTCLQHLKTHDRKFYVQIFAHTAGHNDEKISALSDMLCIQNIDFDIH